MVKNLVLFLPEHIIRIYMKKVKWRMYIYICMSLYVYMYIHVYV